MFKHKKVSHLRPNNQTIRIKKHRKSSRSNSKLLDKSSNNLKTNFQQNSSLVFESANSNGDRDVKR